MDGCILFGLNRSQPVHWPAYNVEYSTETGLAHRHLNWRTSVLGRHTPHKTVGGIHAHTAHHIVTQVLGRLHNKIIFLVADGWIAESNCR